MWPWLRRRDGGIVEGEDEDVRNRIVSLDSGAPGARVLAAVDLTGIQGKADRLSNLQVAVEHVW